MWFPRPFSPLDKASLFAKLTRRRHNVPQSAMGGIIFLEKNCTKTFSLHSFAVLEQFEGARNAEKPR